MNHLLRSSRNTFSGLTLNRKPEGFRDHGAWLAALRSERAVFVAVRGDEVLCDAASREPLLLGPGLLDGCLGTMDEVLLLGEDEAGIHFSVNVDRLPGQTALCLEALGDFVPLRGLLAILPSRTAALLGYARFASGWHGANHFCSRCGHPTRLQFGSLAQRCTNPACAAEHYPRVNPAMIVLTHRRDGDDEWCLLGRQAGWRPRVYSALAGYVEPGESAEDAVVREVLEETGVVVGEVRYHSSQPWPFSGSLMLGFLAEAQSHLIRLNDAELEDARWFSRREIPALLAAGDLALPMQGSIARNLFEAWLDAAL
jgi:NAD+ diphosphatase